MTTSPGKYDFTIYRGCDFQRVFTYKDSSGALVNLTGYTANFIARPSQNYGADALSLSVGSGITLGGAAGTITILISDAQTTALNDDELVYSLKLTSGSITFPLLAGKINVSNEALP